jgi:hypothetical protein
LLAVPEAPELPPSLPDGSELFERVSTVPLQATTASPTKSTADGTILTLCLAISRDLLTDHASV